jgi:seryl-tRNA synthetase
MNEPERARCEEYSRAVFGKSVKNGDFEDLLKASASFAEFRIRIVHRFSNKNEHSKKIAVRWQSVVGKADDHPDANILLHMLESLAQKQIDLERRIREANTQLLERLQTLDTAATSASGWRTDVEEIRTQITEIRKSLEHLEELPSRGGNGSK